jgi:WS/DGAT/MGAT family acyltransferase
MAASWYERMAAADRSFLVFEGRHTHMHVGGTTIFDGGSLLGAGGAVDVDRIREYIGSRLHLIPRYRQRLAEVPVEGYPVWVDDDRLNLRYHVRHASLPRPGDRRQLRRLVARIMSQQLDRRRPLWEAWIIEGLEDDHFAMVLKTHHCVVDGISGVDLMSVLMRTEPDDAFEPAPAWTPRPQPTAFDMLRGELARGLSLPIALAQGAAEGLRALPRSAGELGETASNIWEFLRSGMHRPADTPINRPIGPYRRCDWASASLADVKAVKNQLGGTVNDVILTTVAGAVRRYLTHRGTDLGPLDFRVVVPVSVRTASEQGTLGNRVAGWLLSLPIQEGDPRARREQVSATTAHLKASNQARGIEVLAQVAELFDPILTLGVRAAARLHPYNLIVSNVPGPQFPLYMLGARMLEGYPVVPLFEYQGLGIATFSYDGMLFWAVNACWDLVPDLHVFVQALEESFRELQATAHDMSSETGAPVRGTRPRGRGPRAGAAR